MVWCIFCAGRFCFGHLLARLQTQPPPLAARPRGDSGATLSPLSPPCPQGTRGAGAVHAPRAALSHPRSTDTRERAAPRQNPPTTKRCGEKFSLVKGKKLWFWGRGDQNPTARGACSPGSSPAPSSARNSCLVQVRQAERLTGWLLNGGTTLASALLRGSNYLENGGHGPRSFTLIEFRYLPLAACLLARARSSQAAPSSPPPAPARPRSRLGLHVKREKPGTGSAHCPGRAGCSESCCKKLSAPASMQESGLNAGRELPRTIRQKCRQLLQKKNK